MNPVVGAEQSWTARNELLWAVAKMMAAAVLVFAVSWCLIGFSLNGRWTWSLPTDGITRADGVRIVLTLVAGAGGITALTIAYRRQKDLEEARFMERLTVSARQLGDVEPTVQFAGIYTLSALADISDNRRRQQCINVLCGYIRLPYAGTGQPSLMRELVNKRIWNHSSGTTEETRTYQMRPADREVRETIIREIATHLQPEASCSWSTFDLDFTGAVFDRGDFSGALFAGGTVSFERARFIGGFVSFSQAQFTAGVVSFYEADFSNADVHFNQANFSGAKIGFYKTRFSSGEVSFLEAKFSGSEVSFLRTRFDGAEINLTKAVFSSGEVNFERAGFTQGKVDFRESVFNGTELNFTDAKFFGTDVVFDRSQFTSGVVCLYDALVNSGKISFQNTRFDGGNLCFDSCHLTGGLISFDGAMFMDGKVTFHAAYFDGTEMLFLQGSGAVHRVVDFVSPSTWTVPPKVGWSDSTAPQWILPQDWPPIARP